MSFARRFKRGAAKTAEKNLEVFDDMSNKARPIVWRTLVSREFFGDIKNPDTKSYALSQTPGISLPALMGDQAIKMASKFGFKGDPTCAFMEIFTTASIGCATALTLPESDGTINRNLTLRLAQTIQNCLASDEEQELFRLQARERKAKTSDDDSNKILEGYPVTEDSYAFRTAEAILTTSVQKLQHLRGAAR